MNSIDSSLSSRTRNINGEVNKSLTKLCLITESINKMEKDVKGDLRAKLNSQQNTIK